MTAGTLARCLLNRRVYDNVTKATSILGLAIAAAGVSVASYRATHAARHVDAALPVIQASVLHASEASDAAQDAAAVTLSSGPLATAKTLEAKVAKLYQGELWQQRQIDVLERQIRALKARLAKVEARR